MEDAVAEGEIGLRDVRRIEVGGRGGRRSGEEGEGNLRANAAHVEKCREEALLVTALEPDELLCVLADQVVEIEFDRSALACIFDHLR